MKGSRKEGMQPKTKKGIIIDGGTKMKNILWRKQKIPIGKDKQIQSLMNYYAEG